MHLGDRAVRFQGGWASKSESMPDLREAQVLLMDAQLKCLRYPREGGDGFNKDGFVEDEVVARASSMTKV